jgi:hypothetical protein
MEDIAKFRILTEQVLSEDEKKFTGIGLQNKQRRELDEEVVGYKIESSKNEEVPSLVSDNDNDELVFVFEDEEDAVDMYSFFVESKFLDVGEIVLRNVNEEHTVSFNSNVITMKPELIQAALLTYEDRLHVETEDELKAFEDVIEDLTDLLEASSIRTSGAPKRKKGMGNPFHDKDDGKFTGAERHASEKGGSWAIGKRKLKFIGKGKNKDGGLLVKYGSTKHPCGRAAREKDKDIRCWDGTEFEVESVNNNDTVIEGRIGKRLSRIMKGKKITKEGINIADLSFMMEMRAKYNSM